MKHEKVVQDWRNDGSNTYKHNRKHDNDSAQSA